MKNDKEHIEKMQIVNQRFITTVRRFEVITESDNTHLFSDMRVGDILEEIFNKPNCFVNVSYIKRELLENPNTKINIHAHYIIVFDFKKINDDIDYYYQEDYHSFSFEMDLLKDLKEIEPIEIEESELFITFNNTAIKNYKSKLKLLAKVNEDLAQLKSMLKIK